MIFVTTGTQKFQFDRLLRMIDELIEKGMIQEEVYAQSGYCTYTPKHYSSIQFMKQDEFNQKINEASLVIAHAGVGSILTTLNHHKRLIVVPRDEKYQEHVDHHQYEIAKKYQELNYLFYATSTQELEEAYLKVYKHKFDDYIQIENKIEEMIEQYMNTNTIDRNIRVLMVGSDLSVKGGIVSVLKNYLSYKGWKSNITFIPTHIEGSKIGKITYFARAYFKIKKTIKKENIQIVHIHVSERGSFIRKSLILKLTKKKGCKVILHHHGAEFEQYYDSADHKLKAYISKIIGMADINIVLSSRLIGLIQKINPEANIKVLYNSVNVEENNQYNPDGHSFIMLGRLEERKGTFELLETIHSIDSFLPKDITFNLCGDGDLNKVHEKIKELQIEHRISHVGWIEAKDKEIMFKDTIGHILFSHNEGLPMAILETMAYGIPNISTNVASIPEVVINDSTGILVEVHDKDALAKGILKLVNNRDDRIILSKNSHDFIYEKFSIQNNITKLEEYYQEIL